MITVMPNQSKVRVAICVCTFRRRRLLREVLLGLSQLTFRKVHAPRITIIVVDNDELASAEEVCRSASLRWPIEYAVESTRGITYARNRAVVESGPVDFVAFIDDDEVPSAEWLDELLYAQGKFSADVVSGPVLPRYEAEIPKWVKAGRFFEGRVCATGSLQNTAATNNVLIGTHVFHDVPGFDHAFAVSGAEDTHFFLRAVRSGYKIVWSQEATVFETISSSRGNIAWILRREYQTGNGWVFCESEIRNRIGHSTIRACKACGHVVIGLGGAAVSSLSLDIAAAVRSLRRLSLGAGMLAGLAGHRFLAYRAAGEQRDRKPAGDAAFRTSKV
jgi:succinoglycan biosynthesis protein ExoM